MRYVALFALGLCVFPPLALSVDFTKEYPCSNYIEKDTKINRFPEVLQSLRETEAGLDYAFAKTTQLNQGWTPESMVIDQSCLVERPEEIASTNPVHRRVRFDRRWRKKTVVAGMAYYSDEHHGFRFSYSFNKRNNKRSLTGFEVCRNPEGCRDLGFASTADSQPVTYETTQYCDSEFYEFLWPSLMDAELVTGLPGKDYASSLYAASLKSIKEAGTMIPSRCILSRPAAEDVSSTTVNRRAIVYQIWEETKTIDGFDYSRTRMNGLRVDFRLKCERGAQTLTRANCTGPKILDLAVCRDEDTCSQVGIQLDAAELARGRQFKVRR